MIKMEGKFLIVIDWFSSNDNYGDEDEERGAIAMPTPKPPRTMARMSMTTMSILLILQGDVTDISNLCYLSAYPSDGARGA
jgi:hypothetical protein